MPRVKRTKAEGRRIGVPFDDSRIEAIEALMARLLTLSTIPAQDPDRKKFEAIQDHLDQLDIDHPNPR